MTAFIVQAREEAVRLNRERKLPRGYLSVFALGAMWGREQPATDAEVEAAARAIHRDLLPDAAPNKWDAFPEDWKESYRDSARAALTGAHATR